MGEPIQFDAAKQEWMELWEGPFKFRAIQNRGKFGPGHSLERINAYGQDRTNPSKFYRVSADPTDGAIVIEWAAGTKPSVRHYDGGPGRGLFDRLKADAAARQQFFGHLPADLRDSAIGAYAIGVTIRQWLEREFFNAVHEGQCEIWARVGSKTVPFTRIPADVFLAYKIKHWGPGKPGAGCAELDGEPTLFSIHVAPTSSGSETAGRPRAPKLITDAPEPPRYYVRGIGAYIPPKASEEPREQTTIGRAPSVKSGRPPDDAAIRAKADEMKKRGLDARTIAKTMRFELGFENVQTTEVRALLKGRWPPGRPRKKPAT